MKISDEMRFPHPVLASFINDYVSSEFEIQISVKENLALSTIELTVGMDVTNDELKHLIQKGDASPGIFITGIETYFNEPRRTQIGTATVSFASGALKGRVSIRPLIWVERELEGWTSKDFHPEFGSTPFSVKKGRLLAVGDETVVHVGREKLSPIESIFELRKAETFTTSKFSVALDSDKVVILVDAKTHDAIGQLRATETGRDLLMSAIYLPAVMEILATLSAGDSDYGSRRWYAPFLAKCEHNGIQLSSMNLLEDAQRLLEFPARNLPAVAERINP